MVADGPIDFTYHFGKHLRGTSGGRIGEGIFPPRIDTGLFESIVTLNHTRAVLAGHEHVNNFWGIHPDPRADVFLQYGTKTGRNSYYRSDMQGGTLITIRADGSFSFEIVLESEL
jgi:hypothetical protein